MPALNRPQFINLSVIDYLGIVKLLRWLIALDKGLEGFIICRVDLQVEVLMPSLGVHYHFYAGGRVWLDLIASLARRAWNRVTEAEPSLVPFLAEQIIQESDDFLVYDRLFRAREPGEMCHGMVKSAKDINLTIKGSWHPS